jgi:hypothetical protein
VLTGGASVPISRNWDPFVTHFGVLPGPFARPLQGLVHRTRQFEVVVNVANPPHMFVPMMRDTGFPVETCATSGYVAARSSFRTLRDCPALKQSGALRLAFFYAQHRLPREYAQDAVPQYVYSNNAVEIVAARLVDAGEIKELRPG